MGYFAVLSDPDKPKQVPFKITICHLNIWSLEGLWTNRRRVYCDVGLNIKAAGVEPLQQFFLALPFETETGRVWDLHDQICNRKTAELIFGEPVEGSGSTVIVGGLRLEVIPVHPAADMELQADRSGPDRSVWRVKLQIPLECGRDAYMRVRFEVQRPGRTWNSRGATGALVDLRVADVREAVSADAWKGFEKRIVPIEKLYVFLIAPAWLRARLVSPQVRYARLLEGKIWEEYLRRKTDLLRKEKLVVYYWRHKSQSSPVSADPSIPSASCVEPEHTGSVAECTNAADDGNEERPISAANPFRAFVDLGRDYGPFHLGAILATAVAVAVAYLLARLVPHLTEQELLAAVQQAAHRLWLWASGVGVLGVFGLLVRYLEKLRKLRSFLSRGRRRVEDWVFGVPRS